MESIRLALLVMDETPERAHLCGPQSLLRALGPQNLDLPRRQTLIEGYSRPDGVALTELRDRADAVGAAVKMAFRPPGASEVPVPAVTHLRHQHFVAVLRAGPGCLVTYDPAFDRETCMSQRAIDEEASGYFLLLGHGLPGGWHDVDTMEGWTAWGR